MWITTFLTLNTIFIIFISVINNITSIKYTFIYSKTSPMKIGLFISYLLVTTFA